MIQKKDWCFAQPTSFFQTFVARIIIMSGIMCNGAIIHVELKAVHFKKYINIFFNWGTDAAFFQSKVIQSFTNMAINNLLAKIFFYKMIII